MFTNITPPEDPVLEWRAPQHAHHARGKTWYVCMGIVTAFCIGYSIWTQAWTFTAVIVILSILYYRVHEAVPSAKRMRIWKRGFAIENDYTEWKDCNGFWILKGRDYAELHIERKSGSLVKIQTGEINPYLIHEILPPFVSELTDRHERVLDTIIRICKL